MSGLSDVLERLQEIDTKILGYRKHQEDLPKKMAMLESVVKSEFSDLEKTEQKLKTLEETLRALELDTADCNHRMKLSDEKMKNVSNTAEYQASVKEGNHLKKRLEKLTADHLSFMEKIEETKKQLEELRTSYTGHKTDYESQKHEVDAKVAEFQSHIDKQLVTRRSIESDLPKAILLRYDRILKTCGGLAVVSVASGSCQGCQRKLVPQKINLVQRGEEVQQCDYCQRFLLPKT